MCWRTKFRALRHGALRWRGQASPKKRTCQVFNGNSNLARTPLAVRLKIGARRHGAASCWGTWGISKKRLGQILGETENHACSPCAAGPKFGSRRYRAVGRRGPRGFPKTALTWGHAGRMKSWAQRHGAARWQGPCGIPKNGPWISIRGGYWTENPARTVRAGRPNFGARRHGAASWQQPQGVLKKHPSPGI